MRLQIGDPAIRGAAPVDEAPVDEAPVRLAADPFAEPADTDRSGPGRQAIPVAAGNGPAPESAEGEDAADVAPAARAAPGDPDLVHFTLSDGSKITGTLQVEHVEVETAFGNLTIPVTHVLRLVPGLDSRPELDEQVGMLIESAAGDQASRRESAEQQLLAMGGGVCGEIERRMESMTGEPAGRLRALLEKFDELADDDELLESTDRWRRQDMVVTPHFTAAGRISPDEFAVRSRFGVLTVKLSDIHSAERPTQRAQDVSRTVRLDGQYIVQRSQLNTGIPIERGDRVTIRADGRITMTPWGAAHTASPDGDPNMYGWYINGQIPSACLVGKIGPNDEPFKIGSRNSFVAKRSGMLHLAIAMNPGQANSSFPGQYNVRIRVERAN